MYLLGICWVFLLFGSPASCIQSLNWVGDLTRYASGDSNVKVVTVMTQLAEDEYIDNPSFDDLCIQLVQNVPTMRINFGQDFEPPVNSVLDETGESMTPIDTSSTLFIFVIESSDGFPIAKTKRFIDTVARMSAYHYSPKYLVIFFTPKPSDSVEEVLQYAWTKKMLDFTIIELVQRRLPRRSILIEWSLASPIIHQLDPFKELYTKENWPSNMNQLFPSKVDNLRGKPLRLARNIDFFDLMFESPLEILGLMGPKLNSSVEEVPLDIPEDILDGHEIWRTIFDKMESNNIDLFDYRYAASLTTGWNNTQRTTAVEHSAFCALAPILYKNTVEVPNHVFTAYVLSFAVILIFWIFMRVLRYNSYSWRVFNIGRVLFGVSVTQQPRGNVERIMFTCLLLIFAVYSSTIFECMTDTAWQTENEVKFETIDDLDKSELIPYVRTLDYQRTLDLFAGPLKHLEPNLRTSTIYGECLETILVYGNVTCLVDRAVAHQMIEYYGGIDRFAIKMAEPCFWTETFSLVASKRSPYRSKLDKMILRLQSSGLPYHWLWRELQNRRRQRVQGLDDQETLLLKRLMAIAIVGYSLSLIVFFIEIIYHRILTYTKSKVRPFTLQRAKPNVRKNKFRKFLRK